MEFKSCAPLPRPKVKRKVSKKAKEAHTRLMKSMKNKSDPLIYGGGINTKHMR